jgi:predicted ATPase/signal transduction histidine kinase
MQTLGPDDAKHEFVAVLPAAEFPSPNSINRLVHEYELRDYLDSAWAVRPLDLIRERGQTMLVVEHPPGAPLSGFIGSPMDAGQFLRIAMSLSAALRQLHGRGLIHKDIKPSNILVDFATGKIWLTGFGIASRLPREHQTPAPPDSIAGTLAYMSPEQTGRMNRSIDSRSDLYSLGVTLYQVLTGELPFTATDPLEWIHCHIARQPAPLARPGIPEQLSAIIIKLLSKNAEERYQTAAGLEVDLRRCALAWRSDNRIASFPLGADDLSDHLLIPEKLYGREREVDALLAAFDRVVASGRPELVLVSGYSGIGKSAVINELHKSLVPPRGLFASGKFDRYKRDIPYATVAQAFQSLLRPLLSKPEAELSKWRDDFLQALSPNGSLVVDLVPDLKLIIGEQPPVAPLPPQEAKARAHLAFRRFIGVFARPEHPLALFLDDLQWLDAATLDFLEDLLVRQDLENLLVVGAYRDNEVDAAHPLTRKLAAIHEAGGTVAQICLAPLSFGDLAHLVAESFNCEPRLATPLAQLIHGKTAGNPFFAIQFIHALVEEGLIVFNHAITRWHWELDAIRAKSFTDNVVDLMVAKLKRLSVTAQKALQQFACIGNSAETTTLCAVLEASEQDAEAELLEALQQQLIVQSDVTWRFAHDRVQEAAYSLISEEARAETHLRIGRALYTHTPPEKREERIFEIVNQFNHGAGLVTSEDERYKLAELNLIAGKRAKASSAYASALQYFVAGEVLLADDVWERRHALVFQMELQKAECEFLTGEVAIAAERLEMLRSRATDTVELAMATCLGIDVYMTLGQMDRAIAICLEYLQYLAIDWPLHPTEEQVKTEYQRVWSQLGNREIEEVIDLPLMSDPASIATLDVLTRMLAPALFTDANLYALVICRAASLSIEHGNNDGACLNYVWLCTIARHWFGDYKNAFRFGQLAYDLFERRGSKGFDAATHVSLGNSVLPWMRHLAACTKTMRQAFEVANNVGSLTWAVYSRLSLVTQLIASGDSLVEVQSEAESSAALAQKAKFGLVGCMISTQFGIIRTLRGLTKEFGSFDHAEFDEMEFERHLQSYPGLVHFWYWTRKLQARFFAGDFASALEASLKAQPLVLTSPSFEVAEYEFYSALARAACCDPATAGQGPEHFEALAAHYKIIQTWAEHCPENFEDRAALVAAEIARIEGRVLDAIELYERAISSARGNGFIHIEALAYEIAARFYAARGFQAFADAYFRDARNCYERWGADGKVRQLDACYPWLVTQVAPSSLAATIDTPVTEFDAVTIVKASQTLSGEISLPTLIEKLMRLALEHAGADRGLLILMHDDGTWIESEARGGRGNVELLVRHDLVAPGDLPASVLQYVLRTREQVLLNDASSQQSDFDDEYIRSEGPKSILCLPILKQATLIGVLYLENKLTAHAFTSGRVAVLDVLASQAAISLENARLYASLGRSEALLVEAQHLSLTGSFLWRVASDEITWSKETYRIFGLAPSVSLTIELIAPRLHPDDLPLMNEILERGRGSGGDLDSELRLLMPDGSLKYLHFVAHASSNQVHQREYVGAVQDVTERRLSEAALAKVRAELAHVSRVSTLGNLSASIAHELNQPLSGIITNANTSLRRLAADPSNAEGVAEAVRRAIRDANRAADIIRRLRALFSNDDNVADVVDVNAAVREIIVLSLGDCQANGVSCQAEYADDLAHVIGDRVQLQQVLLNLLRNAIEAMSGVSDRPRRLFVRTEMDGNANVEVSVRDCGIGFGPDATDQLFNAFYSTKRDGMGMGLSVSRSIIEAHSGRLWATPNDGPGVTFAFSIPSAAPEA